MSDELRAEEVLAEACGCEPVDRFHTEDIAALLAHGSEHGVVILADGSLRALEDAETGWHTVEGFWSSGSADRPPPAGPGDSEWFRHWRLVAPGEHPETQE